jgi:hypothetical protein
MLRAWSSASRTTSEISRDDDPSALAHPARRDKAHRRHDRVILSTILVFSPIPLSNVVPAVLIALISLAYLEEDGLLVLVHLRTTVRTPTQGPDE